MKIEPCTDGDTGEAQALINLGTKDKKLAAKKIAKLKKILNGVKL